MPKTPFFSRESWQKKINQKIDWLVPPRNICTALERMKEAARFMERVIARDAKPDYLYY